jgi:DNA-binding NarL/FixJ family response regulator
VDGKKPIRVMMVDDNPSVREGLSILLEVLPDAELVAEAASGAEALLLCAQAQPDVVIMDLIMPGIDGVEATATIHTNYPDIYIIALTNSTDQSQIDAALEAGATVYLKKGVSTEVVAGAIRSSRGEAGSSSQQR